MTRIALRLVPLLLALLLAPAALGNVYQYQPYPSNPPLLTSNCTALNDSSELVLAYPARLNGQGWSGMCAFSFCYQLYSTPFPNQDPTTATYTMSGYLITSPTSQSAQSEFTQEAPVNSYQLMDAVGVRNQSQFMFGQSCGAPYPTANITGVDANTYQQSTYGDNYLTVTYPYMTYGGWLLDIDQPLWWPIDYQPFQYGSVVSDCNQYPINVAFHDSDVDQSYQSPENFPLTSLVEEYNIGTTNYAQISVQEHIEGSGTQFPSCPYYVPPATTVLPFAYNIQQTVANGLVQSSCASGSMTVSGPYDRYPGYQSWFVVNATGTRSFIDVHNRTVTQRILGIATVPITASNYVQAGPDVSLNGYPLWPDNAILVDAYGNVSPDNNGLLFWLDGIPYAGSMVVAETPYVLFARSTNDGHVAEVAQVPQTDGSNPGDWTQLYNGVGEIISSDGDSSFSFIVGSYNWSQSTIYSGLTCPVHTSSVSWTPGSTDYADPAGLTQVGFGYRSLIGYSSNGPASSVCIAGILTLDLLLPGDGQRAVVANATGVRIYATSAGFVNNTKLIGVPYYAYSVDGNGVPSYWYYNQSNPINDEQNGQGSAYSSFGLLFDGPVDGQGGATGTHSTSLSWHIDLPTSSSGGISVEELRFSSSTPVYQYDLPSTLTVFPLTGPGSFVPSSYCPADTSLLATAPGASSIYTNTLPQQQLSIAYSLVPNNFNPENEWLVCANINLTLAATSSLVGTISGPVAQFFQVVNASGSRTFLNLATGVGVITSITGLAGPADLLSYQPPSDNLVSLTSPYLSFNGLSLHTSSVPTYSTGAYGPSAFALKMQQQQSTQYDTIGARYSEIANSIVEASSPDAANSVYYTVGATTPLEQTCDTIVATLQANALKDTTITVPFSYSIEVTADSTYEWWAVCVTGTLTLLSTPFYLSSSIPSVWVIESVSGTRTFYNAWGQASTATIVAATATSATDANLYYPDASGNNFPGAGLTVTLSSSALYNSYLMNPANITTYTITTSSSSSGVSVSESIGDYSHIQSASYAAGSVLPGSTATVSGCPIPSVYPSSPATTTLHFSLSWSSASQSASICIQGTMTVGTQTVTTVNISEYMWHPVLAVSGSRVYTDLSIGQSYTQAISGLVAPFIMEVNGMVNDNLLGVPVGTALASASTAVLSSFGLALTFGGAIYYPAGVSPTAIESLLSTVNADGLLQGVVDPNFTPDNSTTISLSTSSTAATQCMQLSNSSLAVTPTQYYWKVNGSINNEATECMAGTLQTGTTLLPHGTGQVAVAVTAITGTRYFYDSFTEQSQVAAITGLAQVGYFLNAISLTTPPFFDDNILGLGLTFNSTVLQNPGPYDEYFGQSSTYNYTVLYGSGQVSELNQWEGNGGNSAQFQLSTDPSTAAGCSLAGVQSGWLSGNNSAYVQLFWQSVGDGTHYNSNGIPYQWCASLLVEYDPLMEQDTQWVGPGYSVLEVTGNRSFSPNGAPWQTQIVTGLAGGGYIYPTSCPPIDTNGFSYGTSCPSCLPAQSNYITLVPHNSDCGHVHQRKAPRWWLLVQRLVRQRVSQP